jgi:deoxyribodipyrimidine photo-lyase
LHDHAGLAEATRHGPVIPALVVDARRELRLRRSGRRAAYYCAAVAALARAMDDAGARLIIQRGPYVTTVRRLARRTYCDTVVWAAGYDAETKRADRDLQSALEERGLRTIIVHDAPIVPPEETTTGRAQGEVGYRSFPAYLTAWRTVPQPALRYEPHFVTPNLEAEAPPQPFEFESDEPLPIGAGESAARADLDAFMNGPVLQYAAAGDVPAAAGSSRLGVHLSFGTLAARTVARAIDERATDPFLLAEERVSLRAFARSLARRDFFLQLGWFFETQRDEPLQARMRRFPFARNHPGFAAWQEGRTGYPFVDAGVRELRATGFMHPHARLVAASFCCFDLGVDWRRGRDVWDRLLTEDEPALANANWQWVAGVGADLAAYPRIYNPTRQARRYDPAALYAQAWIPEVGGLPAAEILDPVARNRRPQLLLPLFDGARYPLPVVDHDTAARAFLRRYTEFVREAQSVRGWSSTPWT